MAGNASGKRKLSEELPQPSLVLADVRINFAVRALEIRVAHDGRAAVPGARDVNHVEVIFLDDPVQVHVDEVLPRGRAPVPQQHGLHIGERQWPLQQRIVVEINLADRQIVCGAPIGIHLVEQFRGERVRCHDSILDVGIQAGGSCTLRRAKDVSAPVSAGERSAIVQPLAARKSRPPPGRRAARVGIFMLVSNHRCHRIRAASSGIAAPGQCGITRAV